MRSYRIENFSGANGLALKEESVPTPGHGQVLMKVRASALNFRDLVILSGHYNPAVPLGRIPLSDASGEIVGLGEGVRRFKVGDRVINSFFPNWFGGPLKEIPHQWVLEEEGWLTEYKVVDAEALALMPSFLSFEEAATLPCAAVTAWSALSGVTAGNTVLTQGSGGVSLFAVQFAHALGARVISTTGDKRKIPLLQKLGADEVIDYKEVPEWGQKARDLTGGIGVDRVIEVGGPSTLTKSMQACVPGAEISIIGVLAGAQGGIDFMAMFASRVSFRAITVGSRNDLEDMLKALSHHSIKPVIDAVYSFDKAKEAIAHYEKRNVTGKVVIEH